jgi:multisubunit Na+/H+ antiporter MnhG subunit
MPLSLGDWSSLISRIGSLSLGLGKGLFDDSKAEEASLSLCLDDLGSRQLKGVLDLIDGEIARLEAQDGGELLEDINETERLRREAVSEFLDRLWEDALTGRRLEDSYHRWCRRERAGRSACVVGFFTNLGLILAATLAEPIISRNAQAFLMITALVLLAPWGTALVARVLAEQDRRYVMRLLETARHGFPHHRRFGGA